MVASPGLDHRFVLSDAQARELASTFGTPLYVVDEAHFRARIREYREAFASAYEDSQLTYASKANSTLALLQIAAQEGCLIDVASEGELRAALKAGVPASQCHLHGNNKSTQELRFAMEQGVHQIVVDNAPEIEKIAALRDELGHCPDLILRLAPGVDPVTHAKISTGQADTKFGFNIADGSAEKAMLQATQANLPVVGYHCHVGSQLLDPEAQCSGGALIAAFAHRMATEHNLIPKVINVGGGLGVRYTVADEPMSMSDYCSKIVQEVLSELGDLRPTLVQEPGRSLIAESGVTLYQVGVVKTVPSAKVGQRTYVSVDGGLSDNPRPVMYGSKYEVRWISDDGREPSALKTVTVSGKHCETDTLFSDISIDESVRPGDLLQVLCTGAYNSGMSSNYNRFLRPAMVLIRENGVPVIIQRRESFDELYQRESLLEDINL